MRKGGFSPLPGRETRKPRKTSPFVPVRVVPAAPTQKAPIDMRVGGNRLAAIAREVMQKAECASASALRSQN